jgi:Na+/melibiose symporter-like transporter
VTKGVLQLATRDGIRTSRKACRVVGALAVAVFATCSVDLLSMLGDPDLSSLPYDVFATGGSLVVVMVCVYLNSVFGAWEAVLPDDTEKWLPPVGEVSDEGGFRRVRAAYRRRVLFGVSALLLLAVLVVISSFRSNPHDGLVVLTLPPLVGFVCWTFTAAMWGARYRSVLRTGWRRGNATYNGREVRVRYADRSVAHARVA